VRRAVAWLFALIAPLWPADRRVERALRRAYYEDGTISARQYMRAMMRLK
jgi:hypothetical protein